LQVKGLEVLEVLPDDRAGFSKAAAPLMGVAMRRANGKDLQRLKALLESGRAG
jgi:hypothetical protein